jgi:hypothetical protein
MSVKKVGEIKLLLSCYGVYPEYLRLCNSVNGELKPKGISSLKNLTSKGLKPPEK